MVTILALEMITVDPGVQDGRPVVAGTSIRVQDVAAAHIFQGAEVDEIAAKFQLTAAQVHAALAYYYHHQTLFDAQFIEDENCAAIRLDQLAAKGSAKTT